MRGDDDSYDDGGNDQDYANADDNKEDVGGLISIAMWNKMMIKMFIMYYDNPFIDDDHIANDSFLPSQPAVWEGGEWPDRHGGREGILQDCCHV